jgi:F-type H+-transporting ATPase subunit gamma
MQMISTTKVQKTLRRMQDNAPYCDYNRNLLRVIVRENEAQAHRYVTPPKELNSSLVIALSANRGLCGAYNVNVCKEAISQIKILKGSVRCLTIGGKIKEYIRRRKIKIEHTFDGASEAPSYEAARDIGDIALELYNTGVVDRILVIYTQYESALSYIPTTTQILPVPRSDSDSAQPASGGLMNFEPGVDEVLDKVTPLYVSAIIFGAMLNAASCEQSARIMSMDAAARNCKDMIARLSLQYNRIRQNSITQELNEIVSGAQALQVTEEG